LALVVAFFSFSLRGQVPETQSRAPNSSTLQGVIRDSKGRPVAAAAVYLEGTDGRKTLSARSGSNGSYQFSSLPAGIYTLRVQMAGYGDAIFGPCALTKKETKKVDITLTSQNALGRSAAASTQPQFFDEPQFTVAGVTEAMNPGGHGSDTILRTTETLAKETASLGPSAPNHKPSGLGTTSSTSSPNRAAEDSLRLAAEHDPENFEANWQIAKFLVDEGKTGEALPYLVRAAELNPTNFETAYELAVAYTHDAQCTRAREKLLPLLKRPDNSAQQQSDLHRLLGEIEEKSGDPLAAVHEYEKAAELNSSEENLFDWGADLLVHRAFEPAIEVFTKGNQAFPRSARMLTALGVALYARGSYDEASQRLCQASDLQVDNPNPYLFLGKMQAAGTAQSDCVSERLKRFVDLQPGNAMANYNYALNLLHQENSSASAESLTQAELLLQKSVHLDPTLGAGYLQLGILYAKRGDLPKAIAAYQQAARVTPGLEEAHFRLAQAYNRLGEQGKAHTELQLYEQLSAKKAEEVERERREIQQFVYTLRNQSAGAPLR
jgi:tetratricopeptide (TPR) repeat protein